MAEIGQPQGQQFYTTIRIKENPFNASNIIYLVIKEWVLNVLPTIEFQFMDDGILTEIAPFEDQEDIEITIAKHEDAEELMELVFSLDDYNVAIMGDNRKSLVTVTGHLKANSIFSGRNRRFTKRNSLEVFQQMALESGLKFTNPHAVEPSDNMVWYQNACNCNFIKDVLSRSYIPNDTPFFYANTNNEFVYTSLLAEMDKIDSIPARYSVEMTESNVLDNLREIWYSSYNIVNYSGFYNKSVAYGSLYGYYDLKNEQNGSVVDIKGLTELSFRKASLIGSSSHGRYGGDFINKNLFGTEYFESRVKNEMLQNNFFAMSLVMDINSLSIVKLFDKIDLNIPSLLVANEPNKVWSGEYLVGGIQHEISKGGIYRKKLSIHRNGMNKSVDFNNYQVEEL